MSIKRLFRIKPINQIVTETHQGDSAREIGLNRRLGVVDLTALGVAAVLGAGVFSTIGNAAAEGGPAVILLFIFTAIACGFSALCYAEFASRIPVAGSAYTYAYASFGELIAWIIGWDLIMEYAIGNIAVAISWSQYFTGLLSHYGVTVPRFLTMDYVSASRGYAQVTELLHQGKPLAELASFGISDAVLRGYLAWMEAPQIFDLRIICDLPTLLITTVITAIVFLGIEESRLTSNVLVGLKILVVLVVIGVGSFYIKPKNWVPFAPHGMGGILKGVSAVFFAYIGFDAISTTAEECKNPQRDLPRGMIYSLIICTLLYTLTALVLTGMVNYKQLGVGDPLAYVFGPEGANLSWLAGIIDITAIIALSTVLLVFQIGQPRIWMAMSRDGLLPPLFSRIHPRFRTPWFSTLITGLVVAIPSLFMNLSEVTDLTSIGTLFAFILVCGGILKLDRTPHLSPNQKFKTPYINSKYIFPIVLLGTVAIVHHFYPELVSNFFKLNKDANPTATYWELIKHKIPLMIFIVEMMIVTFFCFTQNLSLIPVLGLSSCSYLITELGIINWLRFGVWLVIGGFVYFCYGHKHSRLGNSPPSSSSPSGVSA